MLHCLHKCRGQWDGSLLLGSMCSVMGEKFHIVEKVNSFIFLAFTNFTYLSLTCVRNAGVGGERMDSLSF